MSFTGLGDSVATSLVTFDDHTVDNNAPLIQEAYLPSSMTSLQCIFPDRNDILYEYQSQDSCKLWAWSADIPFCLWHDEGGLKNYCAEYSQRSTGTDTKMSFNLGIAHKHSGPSKVCFSVSTRQFWEIYRLTCTMPGNNLPPLVPTTGFILDASPPPPASQSYQPTPQLDNFGNLDAVYGLAYPDDADNSHHSNTPLAIPEQERDIHILPRTSTHRRGTVVRDHTLPNLATATKRKVPDNVDTPNETNKHVKLAPASPIASTSSSSSSLTALSSTPPLSPRNDSPCPPRADQPSHDHDLRCIYPDCCEHFPSVALVIDHHQSIHKKDYPGNYRCAFASCKQTFKHKADFERHAEILLHQPKKRYLCARCGETFTRCDSGKRHRTTCNGGVPGSG
ncbi:hypothetical protein IW261DRAFT_1594316 [Armillaria novae-zelandiae]|uniref:C2H2-type domain-containing protein n=1 Tax=Armillaria novae-zelandiae TaxID=153914 RepID=A0AA39P5C9_9AGAR|nr:hypothetical protein IW261DRAFT_1594316 [Armillaria novae-zelandiae]